MKEKKQVAKAKKEKDPNAPKVKKEKRDDQFVVKFHIPGREEGFRFLSAGTRRLKDGRYTAGSYVYDSIVRGTKANRKPGPEQTFDTFAEAKEAVGTLVQKAMSKGWVQRKTVTTKRVQAYDDIPGVDEV